MDKAQALHSFWSSFGLTAYDENSVPSDAEFPYLTYSVATDSLGSVVNLTASLWYRSTSWAEISQKAEEIARAVVTMRRPIPLDSGYLWLVKGTPFAQRMGDPDDDRIRRMYVNLQAEYLTAY